MISLAGCFIDILMTKGPYGVEVFMKQLGWEYPHVYREIFHKDPEPPPQCKSLAA